MEKKFLLVTSTLNETLAHDKLFIRELRDNLEIKINKNNHHIICDIAFPVHRIHIFESGEFLASIAVIPEDTSERIYDSH